MTATGIVRRIDDLGRVVMPIELRRTLHIRTGDAVEVFLSKDSVIFKKYLPATEEINVFSQDYAKTLSEVTGHITLVADQGYFVAVAGPTAREYLEKPIPDDWVQVTQKAASGVFSITDENSDKSRFATYATVTVNGNDTGLVILLSKNAGTSMGVLELKLAETAAGFIARKMSLLSLSH